MIFLLRIIFCPSESVPFFMLSEFLPISKFYVSDIYTQGNTWTVDIEEYNVF